MTLSYLLTILKALPSNPNSSQQYGKVKYGHESKSNKVHVFICCLKYLAAAAWSKMTTIYDPSSFKVNTPFLNQIDKDSADFFTVCFFYTSFFPSQRRCLTWTNLYNKWVGSGCLFIVVIFSYYCMGVRCAGKRACALNIQHVCKEK